ncbi:MAG: OmpH family outer membrane protein [Muribaculaceae bacterium]|nr:OmpH family outer membrane protein [Muribaculaceae bacterium]
MTLKKLTLAMVLWVLPLLAGAQAIAVYDGQAVFDAMSEKAEAEAQLRQASSRLQAEHKQLQDEFNRKYADYQTLAADPETPASIKERRMQEIQESDKMIQAFQHNAEAELRQLRDQLTTPLRAAIQAAVKEVGDQAGYAIILDRSQAGVSYTGPTTPDITQQVKAKLGL